jgi:hypothetical protein
MFERPFERKLSGVRKMKQNDDNSAVQKDKTDLFKDVSAFFLGIVIFVILSGVIMIDTGISYGVTMIVVGSFGITVCLLVLVSCQVFYIDKKLSEILKILTSTDVQKK